MPILQQKSKADNTASQVQKNSLVQCFAAGYGSESEIDSDEDAELQKIQKVGVLYVCL